MNYETLLCEVKDQVGRVTLNRPDVLNALNARVFNELEHAFMTFALDASVRVVLITGAGEKAFAAGADINELIRLDVAMGEAKARRGQEGFRTIERTAISPVVPTSRTMVPQGRMSAASMSKRTKNSATT